MVQQIWLQIHHERGNKLSRADKSGCSTRPRVQLRNCGYAGEHSHRQTELLFHLRCGDPISIWLAALAADQRGRVLQMESDFVISVASPSDIALKKGVLLLNRAARGG